MWTQTLPDSPGWYWLKLYQQDNPRVVQVELFSPGGAAVLSPGLVCRSISSLSGTELWEGPIQPPSDA